VTALVKKFVTRFTRLIKHDNPLVEWMITATDMEQAKMDWVTNYQKQLADENNFKLWKHQLELFVDDHNVWRRGSRLKKANIVYGQKYPILILKQHSLTTLVVKFSHK